MRENRPYGSEGGEQRYCSPTPIDKKRRAMRAAAWTPASAGATKVGSTPPRKGRALFEFGETQLHRRPGVGRDPDKKRRAIARSGLDSGLRRSDEGNSASLC